MVSEADMEVLMNGIDISKEPPEIQRLFRERVAAAYEEYRKLVIPVLEANIYSTSKSN